MEGLSSEVKSVRLPTFDGTLNKFPVSWTRFKAFAVVHKFEKAIRVNGPDSDLPASASEAIDESTDDGKKKSAAKKRNAIAMVHLLMAFTKEAMMQLIYKAKSKAWPGGLVHEVVKGLFNKYRSIDMMTLVELRQALGKVWMKQKDDLAVIFEQIGSIENQYMDGTRTIPDKELIAVVLSATPEEYAPVLTTEQRIRGNALSLEDLESAMTIHYRKLVVPPREGSDDRNSKDGNKIGLSAFNRVCFTSGKTGHKANNCNQKNASGVPNKFMAGGKSGNPRKNLQCHGCGKTGHIAKNCWEKESNAHK
jgi:hypothetical protein